MIELDYEKGYVFDLMEQGGPTDVREPYFKDAVDEMAKIAKLDKNERYYHRTDEQLVQFAGWKPDFEKAYISNRP